MKFIKFFLLLFLTANLYVFSQEGPDPCPCDPTDPLFGQCLLDNPQCNEEIPVSNELYLIIATGIVYAGYLKFRRKESFV
jgi:hypothetical protein